MSNNSDNDTTNAWGCLSLIVIYVIWSYGGVWWVVGSLVGLFIVVFLWVYGVLWWVIGAVVGLFIAFFIAYILYINELAWTVYAVGGFFVVWGLIGLVQSYQLKQKAKRLDLISQEISKNWK
jgi:hypothetical protein